MKSLRWVLAGALLGIAAGVALAQEEGAPPTETPRAPSYTTIKSVTVTSLSNGIQVRVLADGLLQFRREDIEPRRFRIRFPDARNGTGKNFWNVNKYPLSDISMVTPQGAVRGIGLLMTLTNFAETSAVAAATPDGQGVLLTIRSDRTIEGRAKPADVPEGKALIAEEKPGLTVQFAQGKLTLQAVRADIHGLIAEIARQSDLPVAVDDAVNRTVSLNLRDVAPAVALQSIATANGLALAHIGGVYMLSEGVPTDLATYRLSGTQSYRMQNTQAREASGLLPNFLTPYLSINAEQNAVVVTAPSQMLAKIGKDLNRVDIVPPQIVIEAVAVEFTQNAESDLGFSFTQQRPTSISTGDSILGTISYTTIGALPKDFSATLKALEIAGKARVRARPKMAVVNGKPANIFIGVQRLVEVQFNSFGQTQTRIQPVDVGVKMAITPLTGGNGEITTSIAPEVSNITELDIETGLPVLSTRRAETTVRVKDGETIAIGGLTLSQEQVTARRIPLLGGLPLVGSLFRSQEKNRVQTELVVFVTPRILIPGN